MPLRRRPWTVLTRMRIRARDNICRWIWAMPVSTLWVWFKVPGWIRCRTSAKGKANLLTQNITGRRIWCCPSVSAKAWWHLLIFRTGNWLKIFTSVTTRLLTARFPVRTPCCCIPARAPMSVSTPTSSFLAVPATNMFFMLKAKVLIPNAWPTRLST